MDISELAALRKAVAHGFVEPRPPLELLLDVLSQHLVTIALGGGFQREKMLEELRNTHAFRNLSEVHFEQVLDFITRGGPTLTAYPEYSRVKEEGGLFKVVARDVARRHRMTIGTITSDASIEVRYLNGKKLGTIEEAFVSRLQMGDRFVFAGQTLQAVRMKDMALWVRKATGGKGPIPQWLGGLMPLSTELGQAVREALSSAQRRDNPAPEIRAVRPLLDLQAKWSRIPNEEELLAYRLSRLMPMTLSLSANDYGLELLSDREFILDEDRVRLLSSAEGLEQDILNSVNASEMAKIQFRDIARIAGLVFQGYPGRRKPTRQVQVSTSLLFNVFQRYDPENFLLKQATQEVLDRHLEVQRLEQTLRRMASCDIRIIETPHPTPLAFPIMVNRLRARVSSETLEERIHRMALRLEKTAKRGQP